MRRDDYEVFIDKFQPDLDEDDDLRKYETYGEDFEEVKKKSGENCEFLWTIIEGDNGKWYFCKGFHLVNRIAYIICKKPWDEKSRDYLYG